jgi:hypothetical protein
MMPRTTLFPPFVAPGQHDDSLPPIDDFLDELPPIENFVASEVESYASFEPVGAPEPEEENAPLPVAVGSPGTNADCWAPAEFQSYDWESLAALTKPASRPSAEESWNDADWPAREDIPPSADEVADALDGIARRIRSGELVIENLYGTQPEAAMAAALAILLRMRG